MESKDIQCFVLSKFEIGCGCKRVKNKDILIVSTYFIFCVCKDNVLICNQMYDFNLKLIAMFSIRNLLQAKLNFDYRVVHQNSVFIEIKIWYFSEIVYFDVSQSDVTSSIRTFSLQVWIQLYQNIFFIIFFSKKNSFFFF